MTYPETIEFLYQQLPMYQRDGKSAYKKDLTNTIRLMDYLGNPHQTFKSVHIAGTNGKGTTAHGIASILQTAGYQVGLYTSPHLKNFTERIRLNGKEISEDFIVSFVEHIHPVLKDIQPSFFEITVAMAFEYFKSKAVDIAVVETGLGGRLDSTNVLAPELSVITNIGYDHMDILGDTLDLIAAEKAGIIKPGTPVVIGELLPVTTPVFERKAKQEGAPILLTDSSRSYDLPSLMADYIRRNIPTIIKSVAVLREQGFRMSHEDIRNGIEQMNTRTGLKGRFQVLGEQPLVIADVSHNEAGLQLLIPQVQELAREGALHIIFGSVKDKPLTAIIDLLPRNAHYYWSQSRVPRALDAEQLSSIASERGLAGVVIEDVNEAIAKARRKMNKGDTLLITGSTFLVAEIDGL